MDIKLLFFGFINFPILLPPQPLAEDVGITPSEESTSGDSDADRGEDSHRSDVSSEPRWERGKVLYCVSVEAD